MSPVRQRQQGKDEMSRGKVGWFRKKNLQPQEFSAGLNWGRDGWGHKISWELQQCIPGKKAHETTSGAGGGGVGAPWLCFPWGPESPSLPQIPQPVSSPQPYHGPSVMRPHSLKVSGFPQPQGLPGAPAPEAPRETPALGAQLKPFQVP